MTDASGAILEQTAYDSFGNAVNNLSTRYQFTGREYDNFTGLHYYRARFYDAQIGRFTSEDPIGFAGGDVNLFAYVGNNPANKIDPFGETEEGMIDRLQYHQDPATREYVGKWNSCLSKCLLSYGIGEAAGFTGFVFGQPLIPKSAVRPGESPGTSPISKWLSEKFPQKLPRRVWAPTSQQPFRGSNTFGRVVGRWIPILGAGMMIGDFFLIRSCTNQCYNEECRK
ncbi:MAG: RHS repeat-associated core domain-containing protein [Pyrinomonadaceae bacterium]|nr:RHS repeat-associated core domain-containing protein [Pyrinomonadaceae bacterium]